MCVYVCASSPFPKLSKKQNRERKPKKLEKRSDEHEQERQTLIYVIGQV